VPSRRLRTRLGFALFVILAVLGLFVLDGPAGGIASLAAIFAFIGSCMYSLRGEDPATVSQNERTGMAGWFGGWV
jgi:membrane associated rhomboid family serine protease